MGPLWFAFYLGLALDNPRRFGPPHTTRSCGLLGFICGLPRGHDMAHRNTGITTGRALGKNAVDPTLGRLGVSNLDGEFHANVNPLAQRGLPTPKRPIHCAHGCSGSQFHYQERFVGRKSAQPMLRPALAHRTHVTYGPRQQRFQQRGLFAAGGHCVVHANSPAAA